ncbi:MAG TPA: hypothetical protein VGO00_16125 [Kofleriaceae bacterium]|nr:hypothetical protein [Kofleriaceae bacterium]
MIRTLSVVAAAVLGVAALTTHARAEDVEVARILAKFDDEPTVRQVQVAAITYYNVSPDAIQSLRSRAHNKAWLPSLTVGGQTWKQSQSLAVDDIIYRSIGIARFEDQNAAYYGATASLSWGLDRLVFNAEELDVMSLVGVQDGVQREVTTLYYVRRKLQVDLLLNPPPSTGAKINAELRLQELTGLLDAYTGGFFSKNVKKRRPAAD